MPWCRRSACCSAASRTRCCRSADSSPAPVAWWPGLRARRGRLRLLVVGGSLGAKIFNDIVPESVCEMPEATRPEVWHQCGRGNLAPAQQQYDSRLTIHDSRIRVSEFIDDMAHAHAWADLVLCRAGAMTVAEIAASGSAGILGSYLYV